MQLLRGGFASSVREEEDKSAQIKVISDSEKNMLYGTRVDAIVDDENLSSLTKFHENPSLNSALAYVSVYLIIIIIKISFIIDEFNYFILDPCVDPFKNIRLGENC